MFRGSSHCSTTSPSHRRIFTISTQDFPHREPPLRIQQIQIRSTQLLSPTTQPLHKRLGTTIITSTLRGMGTKPNNYNHLYTQRDTNKPKDTTTSTLRGTNTKPKQRRLQLLVITKITNNFGDLNGPQTNFPTKIRSYRQDRDDSSNVRKQRVWKSKSQRKYLGKLLG